MAEKLEQELDLSGSGYVADCQADVLAAMQVLLAAGVPVLLWGDPGTGKTETVERFAQRAGWRTEQVIASLHDPTDFGGLPVRSEKGVVFEPPAWAVRVAGHDGVSLVFFDEVNTAAPSVQNALMRVVLEGRVGDLELGPGVRFCAAANPPEQNIGAWDLSAPLSNRFAHLRWPVKVEEWKAGYLAGWPDTGPLDIVDSVPNSQVLARHKAVQTAFVSARPELLCSVPDPAAGQYGGWPSPRSWERTARCTAICEQADATDEVRTLVVVSLVGEGAAAEYMAFERDLDLPDAQSVLDDPGVFAFLERADQQQAALDAVVAFVAADAKRPRWKDAFKACAAAAEYGAPDVAAVAAMKLVDIKPAGMMLPAGYEVFAEVLADAGLLEDRSQAA